MNERKCVFAGTFDPPTLGHKQIVEDALKVFDKVVVAIMVNPEKTPAFTAEQRKKMLELTLGKSERVETIEFWGTAAELCEKVSAVAYVRGIRNSTDFDYETANFYATQKLNANVLPVYFPCRQDLLHISSSAVRTLLKFNKPLDGYVTEEVKEFLLSTKEKTE